MKVLITGATGLIGRRLASRYDRPALSSRSPTTLKTERSDCEVYTWPMNGETSAPLEPLDAVFHLAGEPVAGARWSASRM